MGKNKRSVSGRIRWLGMCLVVAGLALTQGCVAQKQATVHPTLKGDNSTVQAMQGELELPDSGFTMLSELTDRFAAELAQEFELSRVYLDRTNIRDATTRDVANFSIYLENDLEASLSKRFALVQDPAEADALVGAVFQRYGNSVKIFFKLHNTDLSERKTFDYTIERLRLPADSLKENIRSKAYQLAANIVPLTEELVLYVNMLKLDSCNCVTDFSRSFTTLVRSELVRLYPHIEVRTERPVGQSAVRAIKQKAKEVAKLETAEAVFSGADTVLEGNYFVNGNDVLVNLELNDLDGRVLNTASVDIDRKMIHARLDNPPAEKLAVKADKQTEDSGGIVRLSTTKGSDDPVYYAGEKITFMLQVRKPLYLYIYDITSAGEVALLYPYAVGGSQRPMLPGQPLFIPDDSDDYELEVIPPFGMDVVKVFASPVPLKIPVLDATVAVRGFEAGKRAIGKKRKDAQQQLSRRQTINPDDLVDYYRGLAEQAGVNVYEDSIIVSTRPQS